MRAPARLGAFTAALVAVFGTATAIGAAVGDGHGPVAPAVVHGGRHGASPSTAPPGLTATSDGLTLERVALRGGRLSFRISGADGEALTAYTPTHTKDLHLVLVRRDLTGFRHVHPTRAADGTWSVPLRLTAPGPYRVFADFAPGGRTSSLVLGTDLVVPGQYVPARPRGDLRTATTDGYTVTLDGDLRAGSTSDLALAVTRNAKAVTELQPYLGAAGHLVALRRSDLAYLHVHPEEGGGLRFGVDVPSAADYGLFLDFRHADAVHTATFTLTAHGH